MPSYFTSNKFQPTSGHLCTEDKVQTFLLGELCLLLLLLFRFSVRKKGLNFAFLFPSFPARFLLCYTYVHTHVCLHKLGCYSFIRRNSAQSVNVNNPYKKAVCDKNYASITSKKSSAPACANVFNILLSCILDAFNLGLADEMT